MYIIILNVVFICMYYVGKINTSGNKRPINKMSNDDNNFECLFESDGIGIW